MLTNKNMIKELKILFIVLPRYYGTVEERRMNMSSVVAPYGVLSISSYLKKYMDKKVQCEILDCNTMACSEKQMLVNVAYKIDEFQPDIIGLSVIFNEAFYYIKAMAEICKQANPSSIIIAGGTAGTNLIGEVFNYSCDVDAVCYSEGELPFLELCSSDSFCETLHNHPSFITRNDWKEGKEGKATLIYELDDLPFIDFSLVDIKQYKERAGLRKEDYRALPIHTTRGCPFNCIFCAAASVHGKKFRKMSAEKTLEHIFHMKKNYNINYIQIDDDQFLLDKDRAKKILKGLTEINIQPEFDSGISARYVDSDIAKLLKQLNVDHISLAIESGSERVLNEIIDKPLSKGEIYNAVSILKDNDVKVQAFFVIGIPGETEEDRYKTRDLAKDLELDWCKFFTAAPFKGSRLYSICKEKGYLDAGNRSEERFSVKFSSINTDDFTSEHITEQAYLFNLEVNFVNHCSLKNGDYQRAKELFEDMTVKLPFHAFAWRALGLAYRGLGEVSQENNCMDRYYDIISNDLLWMKYADYFHLSDYVDKRGLR